MPNRSSRIGFPIAYRTSTIRTPRGGHREFCAGRQQTSGPTQHEPCRCTVFANAWVYNTLESMCVAQMVDPAGDEEVLPVPTEMRRTIDEWIGKILSAQEPDGYLQTAYTIHGHRRWSNKHDHEGYNVGYFLEAAMAHDLMTGGSDSRLYDAAKRLADCWCDNVGPGKRRWYEGHQELEQALVRFGLTLSRIGKVRIEAENTWSSRSSSAIAGKTARSMTRATCL